MRELRPGLGVRTVDEHRFGVVDTVYECCIGIRSGNQSVFLTRQSIFDVTKYSVLLLCNRENVGRYACPDHAVPAG